MAAESDMRKKRGGLEPAGATRQSLLERLRHWSDRQSWQDFFNRYWRLIYSTARQAGLNDAEAQDVVQETVIVVANKIAGFTYDPALAHFKTWLLRITSCQIARQFRRRRPAGSVFQSADQHRGDADRLEQLPDPAGSDWGAIWEEEWRRSLYGAALEEVKRTVNPEQFQIFDLCVIQEVPMSEARRTLGMSAARVYLAKHRVRRRIEKELKKLEQGKFKMQGGKKLTPQ